jgi:hypothetical protein
MKTRSYLLLTLALALGWSLEQETEARVQVRHGHDDAPRLDWDVAQVNADDAGEAGDMLFKALVDRLRQPHAKTPPVLDEQSSDSKAICAALDKLTAAHQKANHTAQDMADQMGEFFSQLGPDLAPPPASHAPKPGTLGAMKPQEVAAMLGTVGTALGAVVEGCISRPSDLLQVNQAVLALLQRQVEAEERIYDRFCAVVERSLDKIAATAIQIQSTQLAHDQWMKQSERAEAASDKTDTQFAAFSSVLERFAVLAEESNKLAHERMETAKAQAEMIAKMTSNAPPQGNASTPA